MVLDVFFVYISHFFNMPEKHTGILNPGIIVWEVALLYNLLLRSIPFKFGLEIKRRHPSFLDFSFLEGFSFI